MEFDLSLDRDSGSAGVQGFATENVAEMQQASAASQHRALNAGGSLRKGPTASCPDLTAHSLDHAVEEFDFGDGVADLEQEIRAAAAQRICWELFVRRLAGKLVIASGSGVQHASWE